MFDSGSLIGKEIDQFRIEEYIAQGGMGMVFRAFDSILSRTVALKIIPKIDEDHARDEPFFPREEARKRLIQEAKAAGRLAHPNIVTIHSYGDTPEFQYICMEYVRGKTLAEVMRTRKVFSERDALPIFEQVLLALDAANKEGIIHRDIKPSNIMLTEDERVKVMDFGIAKLPALSMTATGIILGTPYYMSPEQITGKALDIRSDIFSSGAVLYEMLTGRKPFEGDNTAALTYKIIQADPIPPNELNDRVSPQVARMVLKALAKDPCERYATPVEMMKDLKGLQTKSGPSEAESAETVIAPASWEFEKTEVETRHGSERSVSFGAQPSPKNGMEDLRDLDLAAPEPAEPKGASGDGHGRKVGEESVPRDGEKPWHAGTGAKIAAAVILVVLVAGGGLLLLKQTKTLPPASSPRPPVQPITQAPLVDKGAKPPVAQSPHTDDKAGSPADSKADTVKAPRIGGSYIVEGTNPNGTQYRGTAVLRKGRNTYTLTWSIAKQKFSGDGILSGKTLAINWKGEGGQGGLVVYTVMPDGVLHGIWANGTGSETLTPAE